MSGRAFQFSFELRKIAYFVLFLLSEDLIAKWVQPKVRIFQLPWNVTIILFIVHEIVPKSDVLYAS